MTIQTEITILSGPYDTRAEGWDSFGEDDFPEVMNPKVIHNPKDSKYYVVKESKMAQTSFITTNTELQELAQEAKEHWLFDEDTDPEGKIARGLEVVLSGDVADEEVADVFQVCHFPKRSDKWDALGDWIQRLV